MDRNRSARPIRRIRDRRWVGAVVAGAWVFLLLAPTATPAPVVPHASALGRVNVQATRTIAISGCRHLADSSPRFHRSTGVVTWQVRAQAMTCAKGFQGPDPTDEATVQLTLQLAMPVKTFPGRGIATTVAFQWNVSAAGNITTILSTACPKVLVNASNGDGNQFCEIAAYSSVAVEAYLYDATNGSTIYPSTTPNGEAVFADTTNSTTCFDYLCSGSNSTSASTGVTFATPFTDRIVLVGNLNHRHQYEVVTTLTAFVETLITGFTGPAVARANLDLDAAGVPTSVTGLSIT